MPTTRRLIVLGRQDGRPFLLSPSYFTPTRRPQWLRKVIKRNPLRRDVVMFTSPTDQVVRALRPIHPAITRQMVRVIHESDSRGCSAPRMRWAYCFVDWTPDALVLVPESMKIWLTDESGIPIDFHQKLFYEAQYGLGLLAEVRALTRVA